MPTDENETIYVRKKVIPAIESLQTLFIQTGIVCNSVLWFDAGETKGFASILASKDMVRS